MALTAVCAQVGLLAAANKISKLMSEIAGFRGPDGCVRASRPASRGEPNRRRELRMYNEGVLQYGMGV